MNKGIIINIRKCLLLNNGALNLLAFLIVL